MKTMEEIAEDIRRAQIYPATIRVDVNDKMTSTLFGLSLSTKPKLKARPSIAPSESAATAMNRLPLLTTPSSTPAILSKQLVTRTPHPTFSTAP